MGQLQTALSSAKIAGTAAETGFPAPQNGKVRVVAPPAKTARGRAISPPMKAWLDKALIPAMVTAYRAANESGKVSGPEGRGQ